ncbi:hypothetical protein [Saccharicrinis sp. GN24d3]|uniref:hypothetical protein n=1 Tax=Saccharicrinis sp. GN24d3 TaxID=3458416 RepID=UPI004035A2A1
MKNLIFLIIFSSIAVCTLAQKQHTKAVTTNSYLNVPAEGVLSSGLIPDMNAFTAEGAPIKVRELCKGKYTVLAAGCLSCPLFHQNYPQIEAAFADYKDKGVQFFYFYKSLRHPELDGYVQAQNISERLLQLAEARKKLGTKAPWIADTMEDDIRIGLRSGSWSVYLISPEGAVVYASGRIDGQALRDALSKAVGPVATPTKTIDLNLPVISRPGKLVNEDSEWGVARPEGLSILSIVPASPEETYYVKLRAEADDALLTTGTGRLFLGFYPDPIHDAHWNNLTPPMKYKLTLTEGVTATPAEASAKKGKGDSDTKPRQFWVDITSEKPFEEIKLELDYFGCTSEMCLPLAHEYTIRMEDENRGSRTYGMNKGNRNNKRKPQGGNDRMKRLDTNQDGLVSFEELYTQMKKRQGDRLTKERAKQNFDKMDSDNNGFISSSELTNASQKFNNKR